MNWRKHHFALLAILGGLCLWVLGPYGGCSCHNPLSSAQEPVPTAVPTEQPIVDNYESPGDQGYVSAWSGQAQCPDCPITTRQVGAVDLWNGAYIVSADTYGYSSANWQIVSPGSPLTPGHCYFWWGEYGIPSTPVSCPPGVHPYPSAAVKLYLTSLGDAGSVNLLASNLTHGLEFYAKYQNSGTNPNTQFICQLLEYDLVQFTNTPTAICPNNQYHYHSDTISLSTNWQLIQIPYSSFAWGGSWGADGAAGKANSIIDPTQVTAIQFQPFAYGTGSSDYYGLYLDDIRFY